VCEEEECERGPKNECVADDDVAEEYIWQKNASAAEERMYS
jgi:hypothetical protein